MGMYDNIVCEMPLPGVPLSHTPDFQTKDLDCMLTTYRIEADGTFSAPGHTGTVEFYSSNSCAGHGRVTYTSNGEDYESACYAATVVDGRVTAIKQTDYSIGPAWPSSKIEPMFPPETPDRIAGRKRWEEQVKALAIGDTVYLFYGGSKDGSWAEVVAASTNETHEQVCVRITKPGEGSYDRVGKLSLVYRSDLGRTMFNNADGEYADPEAEAKADRKKDQDAFEAKMAEWDAFVAAWNTKRSNPQ